MTLHLNGGARLRLALFAVVALTSLAACSTYHGPITNASEGYHQIGAPNGG